MLAEIATGLGLFQSIIDTVKGLKDITDPTVRNRTGVELLEKLVAAHEAHLALVAKVTDLEAKIRSFEKWEAEKNRYQLTDYGGRTYAYEVKEAERGGEPPHRICAKCYQHGIKSIMQFLSALRGQDHFRCHECGTTVAFGILGPPTPRAAVESDWLRR